MPAMNNTYTTDDDGKPVLVKNPHVGLGIAIDLEKADGSRTLMVPSIKRPTRSTSGSSSTPTRT